jgi:hypothetical protein
MCTVFNEINGLGSGMHCACNAIMTVLVKLTL